MCVLYSCKDEDITVDSLPVHNQHYKGELDKCKLSLQFIKFVPPI